MGANIKIETLGDVVRNKSNLRVACNCGRESVVDARQMLRWYLCHCFSTRWHMLGDHLKCTRCWWRPARWQLTSSPPNAPDRFPKTERDWKLLVDGLRNR